MIFLTLKHAKLPDNRTKSANHTLQNIWGYIGIDVVDTLTQTLHEWQTCGINFLFMQNK